MKNKIILFLILLLLFSIFLINYSYLQEEEKEGIDYYILANDYLELSEENKLFYVMGLIDMVFFQIYSYDFELYSDITKATDGMNAKQIKAIFDKYIEEHPKKWHFPASLIFNDVIMEIVYGK